MRGHTEAILCVLEVWVPSLSQSWLCVRVGSLFSTNHVFMSEQKALSVKRLIQSLSTYVSRLYDYKIRK